MFQIQAVLALSLQKLQNYLFFAEKYQKIFEFLHSKNCYGFLHKLMETSCKIDLMPVSCTYTYYSFSYINVVPTVQ